MEEPCSNQKMPGDKYCLRWENHEKNLGKAFRDLRRDEHFCDVAIACEEQQFQAHKVVLSANSPFFASVLKKHSHPFPLIFLGDVKARDMKLLLDFMYSGEVMVEVDHLQSFIASAEKLKVQGLNNNDSQELQSKFSNGPPPNTNSELTQASSPIYEEDPTLQLGTTAEDDPLQLQEPPPSKPTLKQLSDEFWNGLMCPPAPQEPTSNFLSLTKTPMKTEANLESCWLDLTTPDGGHKLFKVTQEIKDEIQSMAGVEDVVVKDWKDLRKFVVISKRGNLKTMERRTYQCTICGFSEKSSATQVQNHVESSHFKGSLKYPCAPCGKQFTTRESMRKHMRREHKPRKDPKVLVPNAAIDQKSEEVVNKLDPSEVREWEDLRSFINCKEKGRKGRGGKLSTLECTLCGHTDWRRRHLMNHVEQKHFRGKFVYSCNLCAARPSSKHAHECHMREWHKQSSSNPH